MYGCETWSLTLREERKLRVFENMVLRRIFGARWEEVTGKWRRVHNEELNDLYSSHNIVRVIKSRRMRWAGHVARMDEETGVYRVLVGRPGGRRPVGRPRRRWVNNIRMDLQEFGCGYMDWIGLAQDRDRWRTFVSAVMNLRFPWNAGNFLTSCKPVSFSRRTLHHGVSNTALRQSDYWLWGLFNVIKLEFCPHKVIVCFVRFWQYTAGLRGSLSLRRSRMAPQSLEASGTIRAMAQRDVSKDLNRQQHRWDNVSSLSQWTVRLCRADTCCLRPGRNEILCMILLVWISVFTTLITEPVSVIPLCGVSIFL